MRGREEGNKDEEEVEEEEEEEEVEEYEANWKHELRIISHESIRKKS